MKRYEALWYTDEKLENYETKEFSTLQALLNFYNKHKDDPNCFEWWLTKRNMYWEVVEDYCLIDKHDGSYEVEVDEILL